MLAYLYQVCKCFGYLQVPIDMLPPRLEPIGHIHILDNAWVDAPPGAALNDINGCNVPPVVTSTIP